MTCRCWASPATTSTPSLSKSEPLGQASRDTMRTAWPASTSARTVARPTNPAPPVTSTRIAHRLPAARVATRGSVVVEALLDELLLDGTARGVEAREVEVLVELRVHVVGAAPVLLDRDHD